MKCYILALASCLAIASCTRPPATHPPQSEPIGADALPAQLDSIVIARAPSALDKLLGRTPKPWKVAPIVAHQPVSLGTKSTVNMYYGAVTNAGKKAQVAAGEGAVASVVGKKAGPAVVASDSSTLTYTDNTKAGQRGGAAATGQGSTATATTEKAGFPYWVLAIPVVLYLGYRKFFTV
jgi:hypothetical protein